jgi:2-haloacid dehalogenase
MDDVAALLFDVFGTLVDWRSSVITELAAFGRRHAIAIDWAALADDWRGAYMPSMDRVRRGERPWAHLDVLHRESLDALLAAYGIADRVAENDRAQLAQAWHRLAPWPDTVAGLTRLHERYVLASLSNGNVALQIDLRRFAQLPFDMLFSAETFRHYKPDPETYRGACELLALPPERVMLVAAHASDLAAARDCGLRTAFVVRPHEYGPRRGPDDPPAGVDIAVASLAELASALS